MLSLADKIFIVEQWHLHHSIVKVRRAFRQRDSRYTGKNLPSKSTIQYVVDNFKQHGTIRDRRKSYVAAKPRPISRQVVRRVKDSLQKDRKFSITRVAKKTNITRYCIRWFVGQLKSQRKFSTAVFMQDGATPHTAISTRNFLTETFGDRIIGKHFSKEWPAHSPDLTPADYYLWPQLKTLVYSGPKPFRSVTSLKSAISKNIKKLRRADRAHLVESALKRWRWCVAAKGERLNKYVNGRRR